MSSPSPNIIIQTPNVERDIDHEAQSFDSSRVWIWVLAELENALESLNLTYRYRNTAQIRNEGPEELADLEDVDCCEWRAIADDYLDLKIAAIKIHERHLQDSLIWWNYVGINPELMPDIARWYTNSEGLKRRIIKAQERDKLNRLEAERGRRQSARRTSAHSYNVPVYGSPFRYQSDNVTYGSFEDLSSTRAQVTLTPRARRGYVISNGATPIATL
ncbi:hypothetical protein V5O48_010605 [Marasmius crinis-equi]|uniref:Uncharacterized protein n=1 Tax=Marasmius crinis-equi TaxID=585013 RepID=A0ABR3F7V5_9AGAR